MPRCEDPPDDGGDAETVRLLANADTTGLRRLLRKYGPTVETRLQRVFGRSLGPDEIDAALNIATYRAWCRAHHFDPAKGTLRAWFFVIASNACREMLRTQKRRSLETPWADIEQVAEPIVLIPGPKAPAYLDVLQECIALLPTLQRRVIEADLRNGDVARAADLAEALSTTPNTIYVARSKARRTLQRELEARGYGTDSTETSTGKE